MRGTYGEQGGESETTCLLHYTRGKVSSRCCDYSVAVSLTTAKGWRTPMCCRAKSAAYANALLPTTPAVLGLDATSRIGNRWFMIKLMSEQPHLSTDHQRPCTRRDETRRIRRDA